MKRLLLFLLFIVLIFPSFEKVFAAEKWDQGFSNQVSSLIKELSKNDANYSIWEGAHWSSQSYGPNSRQWLITIYKGHLILAHIVIGENEDQQLFIIEYGLGEINH